MLRSAGISMFLFVLALATSAIASAAEPHALAGTWVVDVSRIDQPNPPKSVTMTLVEADAGAYRISIDIEAPDGKVMHAGGEFKPDRSAMRVQGSMDVDVVSMSMPNSRTLVMGGGFQGHPSSSRVWTLADDGKRMIEIAIRHLPDGTPYMREFTWTRASD
jgi:hypothetical protein